MQIHPPEFHDKLSMMCSENRIDREIYWSGFGFQVWCQLLTHISRTHNATILVVDEPEIYLHPDVQRQLLSILRDIKADILLATHSTEIIGDAEASEILLVDKTKNSAERVKNIEGIQKALDQIGSIQNITLTHLARTKKILFVEDLDDYKIIRRFARKLLLSELSSGNDITPLKSGGFSSWEKVKSLSWGLSETLGADFSIGAIYDRDFWCDEEVHYIRDELNKHLTISHIHNRKELENYLLIPSVLERALENAIQEREKRTGQVINIGKDINELLLEITDEFKTDILSQYIAKRSAYLGKSGIDSSTLNKKTIEMFDQKWNDLNTRVEIVPGKDVLRKLRTKISEIYSVNLTDFKIIDEFKVDEIPLDMKQLLDELEKYRKKRHLHSV